MSSETTGPQIGLVTPKAFVTPKFNWVMPVTWSATNVMGTAFGLPGQVISHYAFAPVQAASTATIGMAMRVSQRIVELFMVNKFDDGKNNVERCLKKGIVFFMQGNRFGMK